MFVDGDLQGMTRQELETAFLRLRKKVRYMVTEKQDALCWRDAYTDLANELPEKPPVDHTPPTAIFIGNCNHFERCMRIGATYKASDKPLEMDFAAKFARYQEFHKNNIHPEAWFGIHCMLRWFECVNQNGGTYPHPEGIMIDIDHSALLVRLLEKKEPLPFAPPRAMSRPWYEIMEKGEAEVDEVHEYDGKLVFNQHRWTIIKKISNSEWIATYRENGELFRVWRDKAWRIKKID